LVKQVLVVDDDQSIRELIKNILGNCNIFIIEAESGTKAQIKCQGQKFDLIISDVNLPGMDGDDLVKWIFATNPHQKVIMITGEMQENEQRLRSLGVFEIFAKPFGVKEFKKAVQAALK